MNPHLVVALGATAVLALAGKALPISRNRGATHFGERLGFITVHPSFLLRLPQEKDRTQAYDPFVADLRPRRLRTTQGYRPVRGKNNEDTLRVQVQA